MTLGETLSLIKADLAHRAYHDAKSLSWFYCAKLPLSPAGLAVVILRFQQWLHHLGLRRLAKLLYLLNGVLFTVYIESEAEIKGGFAIAHPHGIIIDRWARIGETCLMTHHNTVSANPLDPPSEHGPVTVGDHVMIGGGARIIGNITVGHHCQIAMNSLVTRSAPPYSVLIGVPARVLHMAAAKGESTEPSPPQHHSQENGPR